MSGAPWQYPEEQYLEDLEQLLNVLAAAREVVQRLDESRDLHDRQGQLDMVKRLDFCIGVTIKLRSAVENFDESRRRHAEEDGPPRAENRDAVQPTKGTGSS